MDLQQVKIFVDAMVASDLGEMEVSKDGWTLRLVRSASGMSVRAPGEAPPNAALAASTDPQADPRTLCSPLGGIVYLQPAPDAPPFVRPGQAVTSGQTLCVIEAMKVFNEIHAERDGCVDAFLVDSGHEVESGQPLLRFV